MADAEDRAKSTAADAAAGLQDLIDSADGLLTDLQHQQGAAVQALREKVTTTIAAARRKLDELAPDIKAAAGETLDSAIGFVRRDPWRAVAIGALTLLAFSLLTRLGEEDE
jgi:ElaB/YqjD/DUF883 family membrane-anchored ribosome-binding protein